MDYLIIVSAPMGYLALGNMCVSPVNRGTRDLNAQTSILTKQVLNDYRISLLCLSQLHVLCAVPVLC